MIPPARMMSTAHGRTHLPYPSGSYAVGCADLANAGVFLRLFYPTLKTSEQKQPHGNPARWAPWYPEPEYAAAYLGFKYSRPVPSWVGKLFAWLSNNPSSPVEVNGPVNEDRRFPLVVFSHGNGGCRMTYSMLCSNIASEGFLVAAVEHSDGSACIARKLGEDGKLEWVNPRPIEGEDYNVRNEQVQIRSRECKAAYDMMSRLNDGNSENVVKPFDEDKRFDLATLEGTMDLSEGAMVCGHSFGGSTAVKALQTFDCFSWGYCFDAWMFPIKHEAPELKSKAEKPLAFLNYEKFQWKNNLVTMRNFEGRLSFKDEDGEDDKADANEEEMLASNVVTMKKAVHYVASDLPTLFSGTYLRYPIALLEGLSKLFKRSSNNEEEASNAILSPEQGLVVSNDLFSSFATSARLPSLVTLGGGKREYAESLRDNRTYLFWGTAYKDGEK